MYSLLIAEDEPSMRKWLTCKVDWNSLGFKVVAVAVDGQEAWEMLQNESGFQVLLTDIRMPIMDGLELVRKTKEAGLGCDVVILSGYGDFDYAREAIRNGVASYLLKPITQDKINECFVELRARLDEKMTIKIEKQHAYRYQKNEAELAKMEFFKKWLQRRMDISLVENRLSELTVRVPTGKSFAVIAEIDGYNSLVSAYTPEDVQLCRFSIQNVLEEVAMIEGGCVSQFINDSQLFFWFSLHMSEDGNRFERIGEQFQQAIRRFVRAFPVTVSVASGLTIESIEQLPNSFDSALLAIESKFFKGKSAICSYEQVASGPEFKESQASDIAKRFILAIKQGEREESLLLMGEYRSVIAESQHRDTVIYMVKELLINLNRQMRDSLGMPLQDGFVTFLMEEVQTIETMEELKMASDKWILTLLDGIRIMHEHEISLVGKGIRYVNLHLDRDISLQEVASFVGLSASYFSTQFKQEQGENFIDYLVRGRMEKALSLLENTGDTIATIGEAIGYNSYRYFTKVFKDHYGLTPTQYRERIGQRMKN
jgi:two-component system response regulator YesN